MSSILNKDCGVRLDVGMKDESPETLTVARGLLPFDWGQESSQSWSLLFSVLRMVMKVQIGGLQNGDWYGTNTMGGWGSMREENVERTMCRCASLRSGLGVEDATQKSNAFRARLAALPLIDTSAECIWRR